MPVIEGGYLKDILDQPAALHGAVRDFTAGPELLAMAAALRGGRYRQVVLTGMGSSFHAFHPLLIELGDIGVPACAVETSELVHYRSNLLRPDTLVIVLSQSGRSVEILRLLEMEAGSASVLAVTNDEESPLAACAGAKLMLNAGAESTVSTKTYIASLAALAWLGDLLLGADMAAASRDLARLPGAVEQYLGYWKQHVQRAKAELRGVERLFYVGRGASLATAGVAGLITKESARFPAEGMSAAAFRHGPLELVDARVCLIVFEGDARTAELNRRLARDVRMAGGSAAVVAEHSEPGLYHIPSVPARLRPVLEILPVQMLTLALAAIDGREAGAFALATKVTSTE